jgi:RNA polymerase sigma-70 factor, ECF subfamily
MSNREELDLIARILKGEKALFHDLIRPCERSAYRTAYSLLKNEADAEDATQEAILKAYRALGSFRGDAKFSTWLLSIVFNEARGRLRQTNRSVNEPLESESSEDGSFTPYLLADWREIPSEALERAELARKIEAAIQELPFAYREVFLLRDKEELSIEEIAEIAGVNKGLVKVRLFRARMLLQKTLAPYLKRRISPRKRNFSWFGGRP